MTVEKCSTCKHAFITGKDRLYCKKSLSDKDDCEEYEMTKEEHIEQLKKLRSFHNGRSINKAIQALEQEPCKDCDYSEIMEWEQDAKTGKTKPIYWCERHKEPCEDAVSRQAILDCKYAISDDEIGERKYVVDVTDIVELPPVTLTRAEKEPKTEQFAKWVAEEVIDEELWELNYGAFGEIACRKLEILGIVRAKGDEWELVEPQESEDKDDNN